MGITMKDFYFVKVKLHDGSWTIVGSYTHEINAKAYAQKIREEYKVECRVE